MEIEVGDLVFYKHNKYCAYGIVDSIEHDKYWSYFNNDEFKRVHCSLESLTKVGPWCLGVWDERQ